MEAGKSAYYFVMESFQVARVDAVQYDEMVSMRREYDRSTVTIRRKVILLLTVVKFRTNKKLGVEIW